MEAWELSVKGLELQLREMALTSQFDRERVEWKLADLSRRVAAFESKTVPSASTDQSAISGIMFKIALAIAIPVGVFLLTGDLKQALAIAKVTGVGN